MLDFDNNTMLCVGEGAADIDNRRTGLQILRSQGIVATPFWNAGKKQGRVV